MEQGKVNFAVNLHKKKDRPKSAFLSWILNNTTPPATDGKNSNDEDNTGNTNENTCSNKLEIRDRDQYMMNSSFSTPTAVGSYTQLYYQQDTTSLSPPLPPPHKFNNINTTRGPNIEINHQSCDNKIEDEIKIPNRRQSHLYTQFHDNNTNNHLSGDANDQYTYKRRSYYVSNLAPIDASISNASLSRSATWQPSSSSSANNNNNITPGSSGSQYLIPQTDIPARRTSRNYATNPEIQAKLDAMLNSDRALLLSTAIHNNSHIDPTASPANNNNANSIYRRSTTPGNRMI